MTLCEKCHENTGCAVPHADALEGQCDGCKKHAMCLECGKNALLAPALDCSAQDILMATEIGIPDFALTP